MKILVLGNGFDIDHKLPTGYIDFLNFCNCVLDVDNPESAYYSKLKASQIEYINVLKDNKQTKETFLSFIKNNYLLKYFNNRIDALGNNWIDFEQEMLGIVNQIKSIELELRKSNQYSYRTDKYHKIHQVLTDLGLDEIDSNYWDEITLNALHQTLCSNLNSFSLALEYYISLFINNTPVSGICPDIVDFDANKVISFNYSNTYERVYGGARWKESIEHVHGKAISNDLKNTNIILGITTNDKILPNCYVEFEKYFQRITKATDNNYGKWMQNHLGKQERIDVMFFGHSLDASDSDIIKELFYNESSYITICYFDEKSKKQIIANLIEIMGKEMLIRLVSQEEPKIKLVKQRNHQYDSTAGIEITRDIKTLSNLFTLSESQIMELQARIKSKIENTDLAYFHSQSKVITLFEVSMQQGLRLSSIESFLSICEQLKYRTKIDGRPQYIHEEEWYGFKSWGEEDCCRDTSLLIKMINESNENRFQQTKSTKFYAPILSSKTVDEMCSALLEMFYEEEPTKDFWEQLNDLIRIIHENKIFEDALSLLSKNSLPIHIKAKLNHFSDMYYEYDFNVQCARQMHENNYDEE